MNKEERALLRAGIEQSINIMMMMMEAMSIQLGFLLFLNLLQPQGSMNPLFLQSIVFFNTLQAVKLITTSLSTKTNTTVDVVLVFAFVVVPPLVPVVVHVLHERLRLGIDIRRQNDLFGPEIHVFFPRSSVLWR